MIDATVSGIPSAARMAEDADWAYAEPAAPPLPEDCALRLKRFSWLRPSVLWQSRNNVLASLTGDPTEAARRVWVAERRAMLRAQGAPPAVVNDFTIERPDLTDFACVVMGDTGEGDVSQYSAVPSLLRVAEGSEFALIASDVVYPAGDVNQYIEKFFLPYAAYPRPIYALPGNHDWLDGLAGFMHHFCDMDAPPQTQRPPRRSGRLPFARLMHRLLWRRAERIKPDTIKRAAELRGAATASGPRQPNMYFCIDTPHLRIVGVDTGILGRLDSEQGEWLRRVSAGPKAKLLVSGKPVYAGAGVSPRRIMPPDDGDGDTGTLLGLLRDPANNYVAMVSGDTHHYERHVVEVARGRRVQCVISGGAGAFMTCTHHIPRVDLPGVTEGEFVLYPTRGDSLRAYSIVLLRRLRRWWPLARRGGPPRGIPAREAAAIVAERHGLEPPPSSVRVSRRSRVLAALVYPRGRLLDPVRVSELLDWDDPPFFRNVLRVEVRDRRLRVTAYAISGRARDADSPVPFDGFEVDLAPVPDREDNGSSATNQGK